MIKLYHGSNQKIEVPDLVHSKPFKDFGRGFYLSPNTPKASPFSTFSVLSAHYNNLKDSKT